MRDRSGLVTLADASAYIDDVLAEAERGITSYRRAASRIIGLRVLDCYRDNWRDCHELWSVLSVAGQTEIAAVAADCWPELLQAARELRIATRSRPAR
jgi:hypothetical protein